MHMRTHAGALLLAALGRDEHSVFFEEHEHAHRRAQRDNNMRAALIHVIADAAGSVRHDKPKAQGKLWYLFSARRHKKP
jgi:hypothetical protein